MHDEIEQGAGDGVVRALDLAARCDDDFVILTQVDSGPAGAEQLRDTLDRRIERVRQRQTRDRLAHHRQERPAAFELQREVVCPLDRAQRVRRPHREAREPGEVVAVERAPAGETQLQGPERRLAERQGHGHTGARIAGDRGRNRLVDEQPRRPLEVPIQQDIIRLQRARRADRLQFGPTHPPDECPVGSRCVDCKPGDARRRVLVLGHRGERVAGDIESARRVERAGRAVVAQPHREPGEISGEGSNSFTLAVEHLAATGELERPRVAVGPVEGQRQAECLCAGGLADDLRGGLARRGPNALDLGCERARGGHGAGDERTVGLRQPDCCDLRPGSVRDGLDHLIERGLQRRAARERRRRPPERRQRLAEVRPSADHRPKSRSISRQIVSDSSTLTASSASSTSQNRRLARRRSRERSIRALRRARSCRYARSTASGSNGGASSPAVGRVAGSAMLRV